MILVLGKKFSKHYNKLTVAEKNQTDAKLRLLSKNPLHPSLRTKRIQGTKSLYESSVNMSIRLIWHYEDERIILMLDIGHHDIIDQF